MKKATENTVKDQIVSAIKLNGGKIELNVIKEHNYTSKNTLPTVVKQLVDEKIVERYRKGNVHFLKIVSEAGSEAPDAVETVEASSDIAETESVNSEPSQEVKKTKVSLNMSDLKKSAADKNNADKIEREKKKAEEEKKKAERAKSNYPRLKASAEALQSASGTYDRKWACKEADRLWLLFHSKEASAGSTREANWSMSSGFNMLVHLGFVKIDKDGVIHLPEVNDSDFPTWELKQAEEKKKAEAKKAEATKEESK